MFLSLVAALAVHSGPSFSGYDTTYVEPTLTVTAAGEYKSKLSYANVSGSVSSSNKHVYEFTVQLPSNAGWATPFASTVQTNYNCTRNSGHHGSSGEQTVNWPGTPTPGTTTYNPYPFSPSGSYPLSNADAHAEDDYAMPGDTRPGGTVTTLHVDPAFGFGQSGSAR